MGSSIPVAIILSCQMLYNAVSPITIFSFFWVLAGYLANKLETTFPNLPCSQGSWGTYVTKYGPMGGEWRCCVQLLGHHLEDKTTWPFATFCLLGCGNGGSKHLDAVMKASCWGQQRQLAVPEWPWRVGSLIFSRLWPAFVRDRISYASHCISECFYNNLCSS